MVVAILAVGLIYFVDMGQMGSLLLAASLPLLAFTLLVAVFDHVLMGLKWNLLLGAFGVRVPWHVGVSAYFRGQVFLLFIPSIVGIDAYRAYHLKRHGAPLMATVSSIFVERFVGMLSSLSVICLLLPFALAGFGLGGVEWAAATGWLGFLAITGFLHICLRYADRVADLKLFRILPNKIERLLREFLRAVGTVKHHRRTVYLYYALSNLEKVIYGTCVYLAAKSIGLDQVGFLHFIAAIPLIALLERLPISISAIGIREGLFVALLRPYGIDVTHAVTVALIIRLVELARVGLGTLLWVTRETPRTELQEGIRTVEEQMLSAGERSGDAADVEPDNG